MPGVGPGQDASAVEGEQTAAAVAVVAERAATAALAAAAEAAVEERTAAVAVVAERAATAALAAATEAARAVEERTAAERTVAERTATAALAAAAEAAERTVLPSAPTLCHTGWLGWRTSTRRVATCRSASLRTDRSGPLHPRCGRRHAHGPSCARWRCA